MEQRSAAVPRGTSGGAAFLGCQHRLPQLQDPRTALRSRHSGTGVGRVQPEISVPYGLLVCTVERDRRQVQGRHRHFGK